jgi:hypothetical protein
MKITEVLLSSDKALFEAVNAENYTEISSSDMVNIIKAASSGAWSKPMTGNEFDEYLDTLVENNG